MGAKHRTAVVATALILVGVVVTLASAIGPMPGTEKITVNMPANGESITTRAPMPASSTTGTMDVTTKSQDNAFFDKLTTYLTNKPTFGARAISCVLMYSALKRFPNAHVDFEVTEPTLQDLFLDVCIQLALSLSQQSQGAAHAAGVQATTRCLSTTNAVPVTIARSGSGYSATVSGTSYKPKRSALLVSCTHTATGLKIVERPRSRKAKLATVIGPILGVGFSSGSTSSGKIKVALGVH